MRIIDDIKNILYINLDYRIDRKNQIEQELNKMNLKGEKISAIKHDIPALGCSASHIKCLEIAIQQGWDHIFICEDDLIFLKPDILTKQLNNFFQKTNIQDWDVILVAGNNYPPSTYINDYCIKVNNCQTACGYIVNGNYITKLLNNYKEGFNLFTKSPDNHNLFAIDMYWKSLQMIDNWYLITPLTVIQSPGYSDIEKKDIDYTEWMTNLKF